jgi:magnesium transporter
VLVLTDLDREKIAHSLRQDHFFWLDLVNPSDREIKHAGELLDLHPVAVEDSLEFGQRPKVDVYDKALLLVFYSARMNAHGVAEPIEVHVHLSGSFAVTIRRGECNALEELHSQLADAPINDEGYLVYRILDTLTDAYFPVIDALESQIDALEAHVLGRPRREHLSRIYRLKQDVHNLQRIVTAQREQFHRGSDSILGLAGLSKGTRPYLRDVSDHLVQVAGEFQRQTEDLVALTSTYFNANSDRLNAVATRIAVAGTLFVIWTLVTGFFGQNFGWLVNHINSLHAFLIFGVGGFVIPTVILLTLFWFKRDDWF